MTARKDLAATRPLTLPLAPFVAVAIVLALAMPLVLSNLGIALLTTFLAFSLVALSLDLIWGFAGILSIGQFAFFGIGAYGVALVSNELATMGQPALVLGSLAGVSAAGVFGFVLAYVFFTLRLGELFVVVTIAVAVILEKVIVGQTEKLGGINGILLPYWAVPTRVAVYYYIVLAIVGLLLAAVLAVTRSPVGTTLRAIRTSERRIQHLGYNTKWYKVGAFTAAAVLASIGGALYAILSGVVFPGLVGFAYSFDAVVWTVVGGVGTVWGPIVGTIVVNFARFYASDVLLDYWLLLIGLVFIALVLFFPDGIAGAVQKLRLPGRKGDRRPGGPSADRPGRVRTAVVRVWSRWPSQ